MASILKVDQINDRTNNNKSIEVNSSGVPLLMNVPHLSVGFSGGSTAVSTNDNIFDTSETGAHIIDSRQGITIDSDGDITINTSGFYFVSFYTICSTNVLYIDLDVNGTRTLTAYFNEGSEGITWNSASFSGVLDLDANDVLAVTAGQGMTIHGNEHTRFTAHMIGGK